ncbi:OTU domain-containing protein 7B-like isoform X1 [Mya arenaria]|uniref:OTU domain-containing protein 7B-like isoform X1 n=2 Tax=Mya arenaria TaxID=6604 RepID=UPI0022E5F9A9|nr:OTU domain-containing protein 7B-like isoform X1 [Mya arenaria]
MSSFQQLEAIERLIKYTGLNKAKARDYLERSNWNVETAHTMYKKTKSSGGYQPGGAVPSAGIQYQPHGITPRHPIPVATTVRLPAQQAMYPRPTSYRISDGLGTAMSGMGPAAGDIYPAFLPQQHVPKFPVNNAPKEIVIPIQVERPRPVVERQAAQAGSASIRPPPAIYQAPVRPSSQPQGHTQIDPLPKSQSYPVPMRPNSGNLGRSDNTHVVKAGFVVGSQEGLQAPGESGSRGPSPTQGELHRESKQQDERLSPPKMPSGNCSPKILKRGISKISENSFLVDQERKNVLHDISEDCHDHMYVQTFTLPDISGYNDDLREFLEKDLIEISTLVSLEQAGRLNWWAELGVCQRMWPMATSGDGNCLLHAASLAMWGIHDRQLMLRKALYDTLTKKFYSNALYRRWRLQQTQTNKQAGLIFSESEWKAEWDNVLRLASTTPRALPGVIPRNNSCCDSLITSSSSSSDKTLDKDADSDSPVVYESLEEFHVFVLAHVIQRPIIVVADTILRDASGEAMAPIPFGGIYLPLECEATQCHRSPLLLTYDAAHFSALVPMDNIQGEEDRSSLPVAIPVVSSELKILPLHFAIDPGSFYNWEKNDGQFMMPDEQKINLLKKYMDVEKLPICGSYGENNSDKYSSGSYDSDDDRGKKKDKKGNSVSKQFGSFGKSVGKKLKNLGKGNKEEKKGSLRNSSSQNSRIPLTISALADNEQQSIWCCKLALKRSETHQKMVDNYLYDAEERYKADVAANRIKPRDGGPVVPHRVQCITSGCNLYGSADTSYLCSKCYADQKKLQIDHEKEKHGRSRDKHHDTMDGTKIGKSKFYDMNNDKNERNYNNGRDSQNLNQKPLADLNSQGKGQNSSMAQQKQRPQTRTPSPDYDNVVYPKLPPHQQVEKVPIKPVVSRPVSSNVVSSTVPGGRKCRNTSCTFFGNEKYDNYCSSCYKEMQKDLIRL